MKNPSQQNYFPSQHPVYDTLNHYQREAKKRLQGKGHPTDLDALMRVKKLSKGAQHLRSVLWSAERVRDCIKNQDAEGSARFIFRLAVAVKDADLALTGTMRKGYRKDRKWLEMAITEAMRAKKTDNCRLLWQYFRVNHNGPDNAMELGSPVYGSVYFQNDSLVFDDDDIPDSITYHTFQKKLTEIKKISPN